MVLIWKRKRCKTYSTNVQIKMPRAAISATFDKLWPILSEVINNQHTTGSQISGTAYHLVRVKNCQKFISRMYHIIYRKYGFFNGRCQDSSHINMSINGEKENRIFMIWFAKFQLKLIDNSRRAREEEKSTTMLWLYL